MIVIAGALAWYVNRIENIRWAEGEAMSEIKRLAEEALLNGDQTKYQDPFKLACEVEKVIPHDSALSSCGRHSPRRMTYLHRSAGCEGVQEADFIRGGRLGVCWDHPFGQHKNSQMFFPVEIREGGL